MLGSSEDFAFGRGVNLGGWLSQSDLSDSHTESFIREDDFAQIARWGFDHVRVPLDWRYVTDGQGVRPQAAVKLRQIHAWTRAAGLRYVLDLHETPQHTFERRDNTLWHKPSHLKAIAEFWQRVLELFPDHDDLAVDLLNEPTTREPKVWTEIAGSVVEEIRRTSPNVWAIVEGVDRGSPATWADMSVPDQRCLIGVHFYEPIAFTHQRAFWSEVLPYSNRTQPYPGTMLSTAQPVPHEFRHCFDRPWDREELAKLLQPAADRAKELGAPIHCGEFGVYLAAPAESRYAWLRDTVAVLDELGIGWCYWSYRNMGFGIVYDEGEYSELPEYATGTDTTLLSILTGRDRAANA